MKVTKGMVKFVQTELNNRSGTSLVVDGDPGPKTMNALLTINAIPTHWNEQRKVVGYIQLICSMEDIEAGPVDGYWGPQTEYGFKQVKIKMKTGSAPDPWRDEEGLGGRKTKKWPLQTQSELEKFYGPVGSNQTKVNVPYTLKIAWAPEKTLNRFSCHELCADSIGRVLTRVLDHYGKKQIKKLGLDMWGGCLNVRKMRGGTSWSTHSWGMAIDWDPARNRLRWNKDRARLAREDYDMWWKLWEKEGWVSLGRKRNYDWMHVQAAKVK